MFRDRSFEFNIIIYGKLTNVKTSEYTITIWEVKSWNYLSRQNREYIMKQTDADYFDPLTVFFFGYNRFTGEWAVRKIVTERCVSLHRASEMIRARAVKTLAINATRKFRPLQPMTLGPGFHQYDPERSFVYKEEGMLMTRIAISKEERMVQVDDIETLETILYRIPTLAEVSTKTSDPTLAFARDSADDEFVTFFLACRKGGLLEVMEESGV